MSSRIEVVRLLHEVNLSGAGGDNPRASDTVDLRVGVPRIESVIARGSAASTQPSFKVEWAGGVTTTETGEGVSTGDIDRFEPYTANADVINTGSGGTHTEGTEEWLVAPMPDVLWPFIRFQLTALANSPPDSIFSLYAVVRRRFDS